MLSELTIHVKLPDKIISSEAQVIEKATHEIESIFSLDCGNHWFGI